MIFLCNMPEMRNFCIHVPKTWHLRLCLQQGMPWVCARIQDLWYHRTELDSRRKTWYRPIYITHLSSSRADLTMVPCLGFSWWEESISFSPEGILQAYGKDGHRNTVMKCTEMKQSVIWIDSVNSNTVSTSCDPGGFIWDMQMVQMQWE